MRQRKNARGIVLPALGIWICTCLVGLDASALEGMSDPVDVNLFASAVLSATDFVMVGDRGKVFLSVDGAATWKRVDTGTKRALAAVCFPDERHGWIAGQGGVILHSEDGGRTWTSQSSGVDAYLLDIDLIDPSHGFAVGANSTVVATGDGGRTWRNASLSLSLDLDEEINLFAAAAMGPHAACVAGDRGRIFVTNDGGRSWEESTSPLYDEEMMEGRTLYAIVYDAGVLYGVGIDSAFVRSEDRGETWTEGETGFPGPELFCIDVVGPVGVAAGSGGHMVRTFDGGSSWSVVEVPGEVGRSWLSGVHLHETPSGEIYGLIAGRDGTWGRLRNRTFSW
jgi:photosystem II stability/assembly factor-like uncharacterized protein